MSESEATGNLSPKHRDGAHELRLRIRNLIREGRIAKRLSQAALGELVGVNRFKVMRYERGDSAVPLRVAEALDRALELNELATLVRRLNGLGGVVDNAREQVLERVLLDAAGLESVTFAVADDLDIFDFIYDIGQNRPRIDAREVTIIFPSVERERQLFGGQPLYAHVERQIKRLADLQASERRPFQTLHVYESDKLLTSCVLARTRSSTECAFWSPIQVAGRVSGGGLPIVSTADPSTSGRVEEYLKELLAGQEPLRSNDALCRVLTQSAGDTNPTSKFTRYFSSGVDEEEDVAEDEGFAVALVLAIALCPRAHYGLGRRLVTYSRPTARHDRERLSLFSNNVNDADLRAARAIESGAPPGLARSTRSALAAALDINDYLEANGGVVPDLAFKLAAAREFAMFGLTIAPDRLRVIPLPQELQLIRKPQSDGIRRASLAPRLFALELDPHGGEPELDILEKSGDIDVVGIADLIESRNLNSFLLQARQNGLLTSILDEIGLVQR